MTALFLYTLGMKERFWKFWFYLMWTCLVLGSIWIAMVLFLRYKYGDVYQPQFYEIYDLDLATERATSFTVLTFFPMAIIRWIATGKSWNKP